MLRRLIPVVATLALLASPASAKPRLLTRPDLPGPVNTDGERYALLASDDNGVRRALDTETGRLFAPELAPCRFPNVLNLVGGGYGLDLCERDTATLINLRTGTRAEARTEAIRGGGPCAVGTLADTSFSFLGRYWVYARRSWYHGAYACWINWRTGAFRPANAQSRTAVADPNLRQLERPLCAPIARPRDPFYQDLYETATDPWLPITYEPPYTVIANLRDRDDPALWRCGDARPRRLSACTQPCREAGIAGGLVSWLEGTTLRAYRPSTGRRYRWRVGPDARLARTRRVLFVSDGSRVKTLRVPR